MSFHYDNLNARSTGWLLTLAGRFVPGIRQVQAQTVPYAAAWRRSNERAMAGTGPLWVALGDSLTQGIGASRPERGWVGQLAEQLAGAGRPFRVLNLAVSGARTGEVLQRQVPVLLGLAQPPELITLLTGSNDLIKPSLRSALPATFQALLAALPAGTVVANLPNPGTTAGAVDRLIRQSVTENGLVLADMRQPRTSNWRGKLAADRFHPNDRGYAEVAAVFAETLGLPDPDSVN